MNYYIMKNSKYYIFIAVMILFLFVLAYVLVSTLDKISNVTLNIYLSSLYSTYTQIGSILIPVFVIYFINIDYKDKNTLFLKSLNYNSIKFYISKVTVLLISFIVTTFLSLIVISTIFNDFSYLISIFLLILNYLTYIILVSGIIAYLFNNVVMAYCISIFTWLTTIILSTSYNSLNILAYFDQSNKLSDNVYNYIFEDSTIQSFEIIYNGFIYNLCILVICLSICIIFKSRFQKNGV